MSLDAAEDCDAHVTLYVPQADGVIFAAWEQQLQFVRMEFQFIDGLSVANVIPDCLILLDVNDTDDTAVTCGC